MSGDDPRKIAEFLGSIPLFAGLTSSELLIVAEHLDCLEAEAGDVIFVEGEPGDYVCFVMEGTLDVFKGRSEGQRSWLTALSKGHSAGEMALIEGAPRSATVVAAAPARLLTLAQQDFNLLLAAHPAIGISLLKGIARILSANLRRTSGQLAERMLPVM